MSAETPMFRQIHPLHLQDGFASSLCFRPTEFDAGLFSTYDGSLVSAEESWAHYTTVWRKSSVGVARISVADFTSLGLAPRPDPLADCPSHTVVDFTSFNPKDCRSKSKKLQAASQGYGWQYRAPHA